MIKKELCCIGALEIQITAPAELLTGLRPFFSNHSPDRIKTKIKIELHYAVQPPINVDFLVMQEFVLNNIHYYWDKATGIYYAYSNIAYGCVDMSNQRSIWYIYEKYNYMRGIFHLSILDPISLLGTDYNTFILHSALVEIGNKGIAFAGLSGSGKSTLSYLIGTTDHARKVSDDTNMMVIGDDGVYVFPIHSGEGYLKTVLSEIDYQHDSTASAVSVDDKKYFFCVSKSDTPCPLSLIVFLVKGHTEVTQVHSLSVTERLKMLISLQTHIAGPYLGKWFSLVKETAYKTKAIKTVYEGKADVDLLRRTINESIL